jgi:hypothetical protein
MVDLWPVSIQELLVLTRFTSISWFLLSFAHLATKEWAHLLNM